MSEDKIKDILKTRFSAFEVHETTPLEWDKLESRLEEKRFFKFAYNRFNVYYLGFIALYGLVTTCLVTFYIKDHFIDNRNTNTFVRIDSVSNDRLVARNKEKAINTSTYLGITERSNRQFKAGLGVNAGAVNNEEVAFSGFGNDSMKLGVLDESTKAAEHKDSLHLVAKPEDEFKHSISPVTIMLKQDTIKKYDTVFVYKKKKRFKL